MTENSDESQVQAIQYLLKSFAFDGDVRNVRFIAEGWDNRVYALGDDVLLRVAKNDDASSQLLREAAVLRRIVPLLTLPVPLPEYVHEPTPEVPLAAMAYRRVPGKSLDADDVEDKGASALAPELARFLNRLHAIPLEVVGDLGIASFTSGRWLAHHSELVDFTRDLIRQRLHPETFACFERWWGAYRHDPVAVDFTPRFIHGDLGCEHVLVERHPWRVTGAIDFGDAMIADPALDLAGFPDDLAAEVIWRMHPAEGERKIWSRRDAYRRIAPLHAIQVGLQRRDSALLDEGIDGLEQRFCP